MSPEAAALCLVKGAGDAPGRRRGYITAMTRRFALGAPLILTLAMSLPVRAAEVPLAVLSDYINGLTTAEADFVQENADGSLSQGRIIIQRPGRARFEYAAPDDNLVIAAAGQVIIFDARSNEPPEQYPLARTPLNLILGRNIDLDDARMVVGHAEVDGQTVVRAQDPEHPEYGSIDLIFSVDPVALRQWIITDDIGNQTRITLGPLVTGKDYGASLFSKEVEMLKRRD
jgi:outer membrane lipoprotein-sorting protein